MTKTTNGNGLDLDGAVFSAHQIEKFQPTPRFVVHVKPSNLSDYTAKPDKPIPVTVVAAYRDELIVELPAPVKFHNSTVYHFHGVRVDQTREGWRLTRTVLAMVKLIAMLGRSAAGPRSSAALRSSSPHALPVASVAKGPGRRPRDARPRSAGGASAPRRSPPAAIASMQWTRSRPARAR
jgi:hypothetical protein